MIILFIYAVIVIETSDNIFANLNVYERYMIILFRYAVNVIEKSDSCFANGCV